MTLEKRFWLFGDKNYKKENGINTVLDLGKTLSESKNEWLYDSLKPAGSEYAPWLKEKWREITQTSDIKVLQWLNDNISYNSDGTINIISLNITICKDISGKWVKINKWDLRRSIMKRNIEWKEEYLVWEYKLMTSPDNTFSKKENQNTDWYQVLNALSWGQWDTIESKKLFKNISWFDNKYWTATYHQGGDSQYFNGQYYRDFNDKAVELTFDNTYYDTLIAYMCWIKKFS